MSHKFRQQSNPNCNSNGTLGSENKFPRTSLIIKTLLHSCCLLSSSIRQANERGNESVRTFPFRAKFSIISIENHSRKSRSAASRVAAAAFSAQVIRSNKNYLCVERDEIDIIEQVKIRPTPLCCVTAKGIAIERGGLLCA
jgi:hypothetical protein